MLLTRIPHRYAVWHVILNSRMDALVEWREIDPAPTAHQLWTETPSLCPSK
jgi:hypothetical protein